MLGQSLTGFARGVRGRGGACVLDQSLAGLPCVCACEFEFEFGKGRIVVCASG